MATATSARRARFWRVGVEARLWLAGVDVRLALEGADEQRLRDGLGRLAQVVAAPELGEIALQKAELDRRRLQLAAQPASEVARLLAWKDMSERILNRFPDGLRVPGWSTVGEDASAMSSTPAAPATEARSPAIPCVPPPPRRGWKSAWLPPSRRLALGGCDSP